MARRLIAAVVGALALMLGVFVSSSAAAFPLGMRYCQPPDLSGAYVAATPNVSCATANFVKSRITHRPCWHSVQCDIRPFVCISYWSGNFSHPFIDNHHGICTALGRRRIEFDLS